MSDEELAQEKDYVYQAAMEFIRAKDLETMIDYLQEVAETGKIPAGSQLDETTYLAVLRQAVNDYRKALLG